MRLLPWLLILAPVALIADWLGANALVVFVLAGLAIVPLSGMLGVATEQLATRTGPTIGGLLNATLGNLAELIIGLLALRAGLTELVKASITGSVLGNLLLVLGGAQLAGGIRYRTQRFNAELAGVSITLLVVAVVGLVVPALFHALHPDPARIATAHMSLFVGGLLIVGYALSLVYAMGTHRHALGTPPDAEEAEAGPDAPTWSTRRSVTMLIIAAAGIAVLSELLVGATEAATARLGISEMFVGLIVVPIIGNAAEHSSAVMMARRNRMDLAVSIAIGSSTQVALLVAPVLVFAGALMGRAMDLAFPTMQVAAIALAVGVASTVVRDAESNWLEGAFLLIVYAILSVAFFFF